VALNQGGVTVLSLRKRCPSYIQSSPASATTLSSLLRVRTVSLLCVHEAPNTETQKNDQKDTTTMMRPRIEPDGGGSSHVDDATVRWSPINTAVDTAEDSPASSPSPWGYG
jgi:hypothetical protein